MRSYSVNSKITDPRGVGPGAESVSAVVLVGGMGTRLQSVLPATPKPLAPLGEISFLELLILQLCSQGIRRSLMCTGHRAEQIEIEFGNGRKWDMAIEYSRESQPLGTGGALKFAEPLLRQADEFLVMNGDSFLEFDFQQFLKFHRQHGGLASLAVRNVPDASRYGAVQLAADKRVTGFCEKNNSGAPGVVNGGVYLFNREVLQHFPDGPSSLERDIFPQLLNHGVYAMEQSGMFIDIGTPDDYARAQMMAQSLRQAANADMPSEAQVRS
jgi:D-glycero-alpha-D-manno-heptose 1-phosphate guanylyltransferase